MFISPKLPFRYFFLFFTVFSFVLAIFIFNYNLPKIGFTPSEKYKKSLVQKIDKKINQIEEDVQVFEKAFFEVDTAQRFDVFSNYKHNLYVYENEQLIFWTDYTFNITKEILHFSEAWKVFQQKEGFFLVYKKQSFQNGKYYKFIVVLPLYYDYQIDNKYLVSHCNQDIFDGEDQQFFLKHQKGLQAIYHKGSYLFSFRIDESARQSYYILIVWGILLITGFVSAVIATTQWVLYFERKQKYLFSSTILIAFLLLFRVGMLQSEFPFRYVSIDFFNPKFFASSIVFPSFGDLFLNVFAVFLLICYFFRIFRYSSILYFIRKLSINRAILVTILLLTFTHLVVWSCYELLESIYQHSQTNFDITTSIQWNYFKFVYILIFIMLVVSYFMLCHLVLLILSRLTSELKISINYYILAVCILFLIIALFIEGNAFFIFFLNSFYIFVIFEFRLYKELRHFQYKSYLYMFFIGFIGSIMGAYTIFQYSSQQEQNHKQRIAKELITHHDFQGEYLLAKVGKQIQEDLFIKDKFVPFSFINPQTKRELIRQKIKRVYLNNYFDKYDINISLFDAKGHGEDDNKLIGNYQHIYETYNKQTYQTEYYNLFFINNLKEYFLSRYLQFIEIRKDDVLVGYVILNLTLKKFRENSVYPKLLENRNKQNAFADKLYSYAVFDNENVIFNVGKINYENSPHNQIRFVNIDQLKTVQIGDYNHLLMRGSDGRTVVVSSPNTNFWTIFTNFSYFFLMLLLTFFAIVSAVSLYWRFQNKSFSFSSKIQTYLNIAYFLPLAMVSIATLSLINNSYEEDLKESYQEKANKIKYHLAVFLEQYQHETIHESEFRYNITQLSKYANIDVNLYDAKGQLIISSQPLLYEAHLLSNYINPQAMKDVIIHQNNQSLLEETIGDFHYNVVYVRLISADTGELLGVLSIPFFNSREALDKKKIDVIAMVMNIFIVIFLIIVILSYISFKSLTTPLELIATKLKRTSFSGQNEPLEWRVNDEIGILVNEYNAMLMKLEESKKALSRNEKESAWREMAQQVAHEIKNPLTPMKLKLQHLQYTLGDSEQDQRLKKSMEALLKQVETLNDIATSFSAFAKMPIPENVKFNITNTLKDTIQLYENNEDMIFKKSIFEEEVIVNGDEKLLGRILTNLILNGKQAVTSDKKPEIELSSRIENQQFLIEVKDNGDGIPAEIQHKVFLPNFSTKYTGSGIGLAVAKRGIEHAGGKIWFETKENEGTSFFILLPIVE